MDALFARQGVMAVLHQLGFEYVIKFSKNKLKHFSKMLNKRRAIAMAIPNRSYYRGRPQKFHWVNHVNYGYDWELNISLVSCVERREEVNSLTGAMEYIEAG